MESFIRIHSNLSFLKEEEENMNPCSNILRFLRSFARRRECNNTRLPQTLPSRSSIGRYCSDSAFSRNLHLFRYICYNCFYFFIPNLPLISRYSLVQGETSGGGLLETMQSQQLMQLQLMQQMQRMQASPQLSTLFKFDYWLEKRRKQTCEFILNL